MAPGGVTPAASLGIPDWQTICAQDYSLVPGEHTAQAFQGLTFGGNSSGIGIGLGMLQQQQQAAQTQGFQPQVPSLCPALRRLLLCATVSRARTCRLALSMRCDRAGWGHDAGCRCPGAGQRHLALAVSAPGAQRRGSCKRP